MNHILVYLSSRRTGRLLTKLIVLMLITLTLALPRLPALGRFVTADEPTWADRSASFYYALSKGLFAETYRTGHPGVPTMWAGAVAYAVSFPKYLKVGQLDPGDTKLLELFKRHGPRPIELMALARLFVACLCILAVSIGFIYGRRLFGTEMAIWMFLFLAFNPFHVAHSRFLHTNGLLASFMLLALLGWMDYIRSRKLFSMVISAISTAFAILSITPGLFLFPTVIFLTFIHFKNQGALGGGVSWESIRLGFIQPLLKWGVLVALGMFLIWPAMWVNPVGTLVEIVSYASNAAGGEIGASHFVGAYSGETDGSSFYYFYPLMYLWRSTPASLFGLVLIVIFAVFRKLDFMTTDVRENLSSLGWFVLVYLVLMSLGEKKFDRYFLPAFLPLDMLSIAGWYALVVWIAERLRWKGQYLSRSLLVGIILFQAASTLRAAPYYLTYYNPLLGGLKNAPKVMEVGWGEGLDKAAQYLQTQGDLRKKRITTWYTLAFNWYSSGLGFQAQSLDVSDRISLDEYLSNDYILVYINQAQRNNPSELLDHLAQLEPEKVIEIDGQAYVWIYHFQPGINP